ncbi:putative transcriptional regulator [Xylanimonas cellulosilytica DSM 15894]|uniref:Transcriptional regulator n=1 Tax=Xylanimonas cellulosilytica (strain DSM 15894 / JCM 12276 / CECT 5975 / KCTC 9989 / LMG 20990 / NBRC 107835 / XIL07) TaxID=446471 RepID=D1BYM8_XYLCX|nr:RNA-binding domain-containing protein [Xylanimonas cellulosilytica]ACZ31900.1 putative transcriptional regulator [Xylanimonas cellulosilytica DSM 15894]
MREDELDALLRELRAVKTDHQAVEAKRAAKALPDSTHETLSAFANSEGGTLILGVDERSGEFVVTGVVSARQTQSDLQSLCALMEPPLRATIDLVDHSDGTVVVARIPAVPRSQRPCHLASLPAEDGSFVRVGDGDQRLTADEVRSMLAASGTADHSAIAAPAGSELDQRAVDGFLSVVRSLSSRNNSLDDAALLRRWRVVDDQGEPSLAGALTVGESPQSRCAAARVTYRVLPRTTDPVGTRHSGRHLEGTVGELLDDAVALLRADLGQVQAVREGEVVDVPPVPLEAIREYVSNALVHRSLAPHLRDRHVLIEVSEDAVVIASPGNLFTSTDPELLGLSPISGVRNLTLVRISEQLRSPRGARIVENQTSGIEAADRACHIEGTMPALFIDRPDSFQVLVPRGVMDTRVAHTAVGGGLGSHPADLTRLLTVATRLDELRTVYPELGAVVFDAALAARSLAPCTIETASARLSDLEAAGALRRLTARRRPVWAPVPVLPNNVGATTMPSKRTRDRVPDLIAAIVAAPDGVLTPRQIGDALGLTSPTSRNRWITRARDKGLIRPTSDNPFDPTIAYKVTSAGVHILDRAHPSASRRPRPTGR